jgi:aminoglycoside phosphotransferase (APT) family kinase protein
MIEPQENGKEDIPRYLGALTEVRPQFRIDLKKLGSYLADTLGVVPKGLTIQQFQGGQSNPTYRLTAREGCYVLRRRPPGNLLASAHAIDREFRIMKALASAGFPVPQPLVYCDDDGVIGSAFYIMAHVPGRIFMDISMPDLSPAQRACAYDSANATLAELHKLEPERLGLGDFGRPGNYFARQIARWSKQYVASRSEDIPAMERLMLWLPTAVPPEAPARIVHGDYSFHNLLFHEERPEVAALIDWELATTGDPIADLTYHAMEWYRPIGVDPRGSLLGMSLSALGIPTLDSYIARYCERVGRPLIENLSFYKAYNLFRTAAIFQGIVARQRAGNATASNTSRQAAGVRPLAEAAWREAQRAGAL